MLPTEKTRLGLLLRWVVSCTAPFCYCSVVIQAESDCGSFQTSGEMKSFGRGKMQKPFEETSFALAVGELSDIVTTDSGVHIIYRMK